MKTTRAIALALLLAGLCDAESKADRAWKWSIAALAAGNAADAASSWNKREANPLLGHTFGVTGIGIKGGIVAGTWLLQRHCPKNRKVQTIANFSMGGVLAGLAIRNFVAIK